MQQNSLKCLMIKLQQKFFLLNYNPRGHLNMCINVKNLIPIVCCDLFIVALKIYPCKNWVC